MTGRNGGNTILERSRAVSRKNGPLLCGRAGGKLVRMNFKMRVYKWCAPSVIILGFQKYFSSIKDPMHRRRSNVPESKDHMTGRGESKEMLSEGWVGLHVHHAYIHTCVSAAAKA